MLPGISVIVTTHDQCESLRKHLPMILEQEYGADFEVIVVDVKSSDDTLPYLESLEGMYPNLHIIRTPDTARNISLSRMALTLGFRAASYDWVLVTQADCQPSSPHWLTKMGETCQDDKVKMVLGYTRFVGGEGWKGLCCRFFRAWQQMLHLSWLKGHRAYRCDGTNLCYRRSFFLEHRGFADDVNLQLGATDIMVNRNSTRDNTRYVASPDAIVMQDAPQFYSKWQQDRVFFMETRRHFSHTILYRLRYLLSTLATWVPTLLATAAIVYGIVCKNPFIIIAAVLAWIALMAYRTYRINRQLTALSEPQIVALLPLLLHMVPVWDTAAWLRWLFTKRQIFQKRFI